MKPKPLFRYITILFAAFVGICFLESRRKANNVYNKNSEIVSKADDFEATSNDFIFLEAVSKYLLISFTK